MAGIPEVKRFFREAGDVDVDKSDIDRFRAFVDEKIDDIAVSARDTARWNDRDVIAPQDLPITKGLQERMREFDQLDVADEVRELLRATVRRPPGDVTFAEDTERLLPELFGGLSIALARSFRILDPRVVRPGAEHWDRAFAVFELVY